MIRYAKTAVGVLGVAGAVSMGQPVTYDFSGTLGDHFVPFIDDSEISSSQSGGVLRFDTGGVVTTDDPGDAYAHTTFTPSYTESWTASIEFDLPLVYDSNYTPHATIEKGIALGIVAIFTDGDTTWNSVASSFELYDPGSDNGPPERQYYADEVTDDIGGEENWLDATGDATGTLTVSFDATTKIMTASNGNGDILLVLDIDDPGSDWGMTDTDTFQVGFYGAADNRAVLSSTPVTVDNFAAEVVVTGVSYDFAGVLGDHFAPFIDEPGIDSAQTGGELIFDTDDAVVAGDTTDAYAHTSFAPRFDQSWTASIEFGLSLAYDSNFAPSEAVEQFVGLGLVAIYDDGVNPMSAVDTTIEVWHGMEPGSVTLREQGVFWNYQEGEDDLWQGIDAGGVTSGTLTLTFNATNKVITATSGGATIGSYDLDAPGTDWGMGESETFGIGLFGGAENRSIFANDPLTLDNFSAALIADPEPECQPDMNDDGFVDAGDIGLFVQAFLAGDFVADMNSDGFIDAGDIGIFVQAFLAGC